MKFEISMPSDENGRADSLRALHDELVRLSATAAQVESTFDPEEVLEAALDEAAPLARNLNIDLAGWIEGSTATVRGDAAAFARALARLVRHGLESTKTGSVTVVGTRGDVWRFDCGGAAFTVRLETASPAPERLKEFPPVLIVAPPATSTALNYWLSSAGVRSTCSAEPVPTASGQILIAPPDTVGLWRWRGPRVLLRHRGEPHAPADPITEHLSRPVHRRETFESLHRLAAVQRQAEVRLAGHVLVIDDNHDRAHTTLWNLTRIGYSAEHVRNWAEATAALANTSFDAVLVCVQDDAGLATAESPVIQATVDLSITELESMLRRAIMRS